LGRVFDPIDEKAQPVPHGLLVLPFPMRVAGAEKRQQRQRSRRTAGLCQGPGLAALAGTCARPCVIQGPSTIKQLMLGEPLQTRRDRPRVAVG
jgi:hypothetical protein